jgi:hypothetical protein
MHFHVGAAEFLVWLCYYVIAKALFQVINVEARRNGKTTTAGVTGLFS